MTAACAAAVASTKARTSSGSDASSSSPTTIPGPGHGAISSTVNRSTAHSPGLKLERLVVAEPGDEVDVAVRQAVDLVELRVLADGDVVGGQAAGSSRASSACHDDPNCPGVPIARPARSAGFVGTVPSSPIRATGKRW